ncbi:hypothetical protein GCM10027294_43960 [Marinactinospora endophytica]
MGPHQLPSRNNIRPTTQERFPVRTARLPPGPGRHQEDRTAPQGMAAPSWTMPLPPAQDPLKAAPAQRSGAGFDDKTVDEVVTIELATMIRIGIQTGLLPVWTDAPTPRTAPT